MSRSGSNPKNPPHSNARRPTCLSPAIDREAIEQGVRDQGQKHQGQHPPPMRPRRRLQFADQPGPQRRHRRHHQRGMTPRTVVGDIAHGIAIRDENVQVGQQPEESAPQQRPPADLLAGHRLADGRPQRDLRDRIHAGMVEPARKSTNNPLPINSSRFHPHHVTHRQSARRSPKRKEPRASARAGPSKRGPSQRATSTQHTHPSQAFPGGQYVPKIWATLNTDRPATRRDRATGGEGQHPSGMS
jgi:hypothetical protein